MYILEDVIEVLHEIAKTTWREWKKACTNIVRNDERIGILTNFDYVHELHYIF